MNIAVFGMGYVGCVTAACLVREGHNVIGVDIIDRKVNGLNNGVWPIFEPGLCELNEKKILKENFLATSNEIKTLDRTEIGIICVGTPNQTDGGVELKYFESVMKNISKYFKKSSKDFILLVRSTIPPGSTQKIINEQFRNMNNIHIAFLPEFLREGNAINDFFSPSLKVIGCEKDFPVNLMDKIFPNVKGIWNVTNFEIAESLKYISNTWHALKIVFANEIASILKEYNVNSEQAMKLFSKDKILNISSYYMKPGFAYGGSCLPKDLSALLSLSQKASIDTPLLNSISISNTELINRLEIFITSQEFTNIIFSGISFKPNTDDIRNSPIITVIKKLITRRRSYQKRYNISIYDQQNTLNNFSKDIGLDVNKITDENKISDEGDIIILGPHVISEGTIFTMLKNNKIIIDLKWHKLSEEIKSHTNYRSLL